MIPLLYDELKYVYGGCACIYNVCTNLTVDSIVYKYCQTVSEQAPTTETCIAAAEESKRNYMFSGYGFGCGGLSLNCTIEKVCNFPVITSGIYNAGSQTKSLGLAIIGASLFVVFF